jgi:hypothetical protein
MVPIPQAEEPKGVTGGEKDEFEPKKCTASAQLEFHPFESHSLSGGLTL